MKRSTPSLSKVKLPLPLLALLITPPLTSIGFVTNQINDNEISFKAIVIIIPPEENSGFVFLNVPVKTKGDTIRSHWNPSQHTLMINGGYFNADFSPTGLCRIDGVTIGSTKSPKLSGFIALNREGTLSILTQHDDLSIYPTVLQSGPFVIDPGGFIGIKSQSGARARRTLIGAMNDQSLVVIITEPIFLFDLAHAIRKHLPAIERLLNLDGGPSTALATEEFLIQNNWPVRNYLFKTSGEKQSPTP